MKKTCLAVLFSVLLVPAGLYARTEGHFDRTLQVSGAVNLALTTGSGDIVIKSGGSNQVVVHGTIHGSSWFGEDTAVHQVESNPPIQQNGNSVRIGYNLPSDVGRHVSIDYEVTVPASTTVTAHSGSGNVEVSGVRSDVDAQTGSGEVNAHDLGGHVHLQTGSGSLRAENVTAPFYGQTGSGDIEVSLTGSGDVDVHTGSGSIRVRGINGGIRARTGSGDIEAAGAVARDWQLHSGSGSIHLALAPSGGFDLNVRTSSGTIHSELPITVQGSLGKNELKGAVRGGGPEVEVSTSSGDVEIR